MREYVLRIAGVEHRAQVREITADQARIAVDGHEYRVDLVEIGRGDATAEAPARPRPRPTTAPLAAPLRAAPKGSAGAVPAPLPGLVVEVKVAEGQAVSAGQPVVVMEAMKMENTIAAPHDGTVRKILVGAGDSVAEGDALIEIARPEMTTL
jgi:biotin carboxyl carrier protein